MQNLRTQYSAQERAYSYLKRTLLLGMMTGWLFTYGCGAPIPPSQSVSKSTQDELTPILGPITKGKVLDRLKGYPICGMKGEEQKLTLQVRTYPLTKTDHPVSLVQVECFFFGVQGLYEFAIINPKDGRIYPLVFQGAEPVRSSLQGSERRSPVALNQRRSEMCGVPDFDLKRHSLKVTCKADPSGGCGAYSEYKLTQRDGSDDPKMTYFKLVESRFHSCAQPMIPDVGQWSDITP
jgi:hypothetical protein